MKKILVQIMLLVSALRLLPHWVVLIFSPNKTTIFADLRRWNDVIYGNPDAYGPTASFVRHMTLLPEYRNLFYHRTGWKGKLLRPLCPQLSTLYIATKDIGPGLFIQHGFATIIAAQKIGSNCRINQQVTIGYSNQTDKPTIGDNVKVSAGAKVIGNVELGNNSIIGANAVVVKDIPANSTAVGIPAKVIKLNGIRV